MTHIIAVSNRKGGVGKTTTCLSLGACLAEMGLRTLVVDLDSQGDLTMAAGLEADAGDLEWTVADLLIPGDANVTPAAVIRPTVQKGLDILPADVRLAGAERFLYDQEGYEATLGRLLGWLAGYDHILLDCPPSLGAITLMALTAADAVLAPIQCEYYAARRLVSLLDIIDAVRQRTNPGLGVMLVATLYDQRNLIARKVLEQLQTRFASRLFHTVIGVDTHLRECPVVGEPIIVYAPNTRASQQYRQLAREFIVRVGMQKQRR
jgi:chromosome partitioning protein